MYITHIRTPPISIREPGIQLGCRWPDIHVRPARFHAACDLTHTQTHTRSACVCGWMCMPECQRRTQRQATPQGGERVAAASGTRALTTRAGSWIPWQLAVRAGELGSRALVNSVDVCSWSGAPPQPRWGRTVRLFCFRWTAQHVSLPNKGPIGRGSLTSSS